MDKFAALIAMLALGGVIYFGMNKDAGGGDVGALAEQVELMRSEHADLSARLDKLAGARAPAILDGTLPSKVPGYESGGPATDASGKTLLPMGVRIARLEELVKAQDKTLAQVKETAESSPKMPFMSNKRFFRSSDDAAKALKLSDAQKSDMDRVLDNARNEMSRLYDTQNEDGITLSEMQRGMTGMITDGKKVDHSKILSHFGKISAFKQSKVPGSDETFQDAEQRIHNAAMADIRRDLSPDQQREWDQSSTQGLLPGGAATASFLMTSDTPVVFDSGK